MSEFELKPINNQIESGIYILTTSKIRKGLDKKIENVNKYSRSFLNEENIKKDTGEYDKFKKNIEEVKKEYEKGGMNNEEKNKLLKKIDRLRYTMNSLYEKMDGYNEIVGVYSNIFNIIPSKTGGAIRVVKDHPVASLAITGYGARNLLRTITYLFGKSFKSKEYIALSSFITWFKKKYKEEFDGIFGKSGKKLISRFNNLKFTQNDFDKLFSKDEILVTIKDYVEEMGDEKGVELINAMYKAISIGRYAKISSKVNGALKHLFTIAKDILVNDRNIEYFGKYFVSEIKKGKTLMEILLGFRSVIGNEINPNGLEGKTIEQIIKSIENGGTIADALENNSNKLSKHLKNQIIERYTILVKDNGFVGENELKLLLDNYLINRFNPDQLERLMLLDSSKYSLLKPVKLHKLRKYLKEKFRENPEELGKLLDELAYGNKKSLRSAFQIIRDFGSDKLDENDLRKIYGMLNSKGVRDIPLLQRVVELSSSLLITHAQYIKLRNYLIKNINDNELLSEVGSKIDEIIKNPHSKRKDLIKFLENSEINLNSEQMREVERIIPVKSVISRASKFSPLRFTTMQLISIITNSTSGLLQGVSKASDFWSIIGKKGKYPRFNRDLSSSLSFSDKGYIVRIKEMELSKKLNKQFEKISKKIIERDTIKIVGTIFDKIISKTIKEHQTITGYVIIGAIALVYYELTKEKGDEENENGQRENQDDEEKTRVEQWKELIKKYKKNIQNGDQDDKGAIPHKINNEGVDKDEKKRNFEYKRTTKAKGILDKQMKIMENNWSDYYKKDKKDKKKYLTVKRKYEKVINKYNEIDSYYRVSKNFSAFMEGLSELNNLIKELPDEIKKGVVIKK